MEQKENLDKVNQPKITMMSVVTNPCLMCGKVSSVKVPVEGYRAWKFHGQLIQRAMPGLSANERELLISGTHAECWDRLFH